LATSSPSAWVTTKTSTHEVSGESLRHAAERRAAKDRFGGASPRADPHSSATACCGVANFSEFSLARISMYGRWSSCSQPSRPPSRNIATRSRFAAASWQVAAPAGNETSRPSSSFANVSGCSLAATSRRAAAAARTRIYFARSM
jgi:hypothetical protein